MVGGRLAALESIETLREGLMRGSRMRVALADTSERWIEAAMRAGATGATMLNGSLVIASRPEDRLVILESLKCAGAGISNFVTLEQSLEDIYLHYINGQNTLSENSMYSETALRLPATRCTVADRMRRTEI